jgi:hypothetical protein
MNRYDVIGIVVFDDQGRKRETFRIRDCSARDPFDNLLPLVYLTEEPAQIDARRLNWALGDSRLGA